VTLFSCNPQEEGYTEIKGVLIHGLTKVSIPNHPVKIIAHHNNLWKGIKEQVDLMETKTNDQGEFEFFFEAKKEYDYSVSTKESDCFSIGDKFIQKASVNDVELTVFDIATIQISLDEKLLGDSVFYELKSSNGNVMTDFHHRVRERHTSEKVYVNSIDPGRPLELAWTIFTPAATIQDTVIIDPKPCDVFDIRIKE